jgi:hydroxymethylbilane synthase
MTRKARLIIGTRGSPLALIQAELVKHALTGFWPELAAPGAVEIAVVRTAGDRIQDRPLAEIGGKGLFTREIDEAQLSGRIDLAVHSMKDVPTYLPEGIVIPAMLPRADPRDVLIAKVTSIADLPEGAVVGTSSLRRRAQLLAARPDLRIVELRGNVQTRLAKVESGLLDATILASAGLDRLGLTVGTPIALDEMLPSPAQGAIGIACRADDDRMLALLAPVADVATMAAVTAERALLRVLDGSCGTPIAALALPDGGDLSLAGLVASIDGTDVRRAGGRGPASDAQALGETVGHDLIKG